LRQVKGVSYEDHLLVGNVLIHRIMNDSGPVFIRRNRLIERISGMNDFGRGRWCKDRFFNEPGLRFPEQEDGTDAKK
jgi:hypothetical protein